MTSRFNRLSAALAIQICWRAFCNRRVYIYFRDLVIFKLKGLPQDLLKTIIPSEVSLCDRASGIHVRFRLGGQSFPPKVFFKIFTHRAVCDVGAFAPRDYTAKSPLDSRQRHNRVMDSVSSLTNIRVGGKYFDVIVPNTISECNGWYKRQENNSWRPIASEAFEDLLLPPVFFLSFMLSMNHNKVFHFRNRSGLGKIK
jgi:hypothetical protein